MICPECGAFRTDAKALAAHLVVAHKMLPADADARVRAR